MAKLTDALDYLKDRQVRNLNSLAIVRTLDTVGVSETLRKLSGVYIIQLNTLTDEENLDEALKSAGTYLKESGTPTGIIVVTEIYKAPLNLQLAFQKRVTEGSVRSCLAVYDSSYYKEMFGMYMAQEFRYNKAKVFDLRPQR